jgi:H+-translocating NAD(P) transhydrogenase subunit alpha
MSTRSAWLRVAMIAVMIACGIVIWFGDPAAQPRLASADEDVTITNGIIRDGSPESDAIVSADDAPVAREPVDSPVAATRVRQDVLASLTIFVLAIFVGFEIITKVPPTLHTPLMSGSNAISGITLVGAVTVTGVGQGLSPLLGFFAVLLAAINVVGGFLVTHRMLAMFKRR